MTETTIWHWQGRPRPTITWFDVGGTYHSLESALKYPPLTKEYRLVRRTITEEVISPT